MMIIGVPKEIKTYEHRTGLVAQNVAKLTQQGHTVLIQSGTGIAAGVSDNDYISAGAKVVASAKDVFANAELIIKVKEPQLEECLLLSENQIIFTFLHLAADKKLANMLLQTGVTAIAYETVTDLDGNLPILTPMSIVAGRMAVQLGAHYLEYHNGGRGILLGPVAGMQAAKVTVIGAGIVGSNAVAVALGMGANVCVIDKNRARLDIIKMANAKYVGQLECFEASEDVITREVIGSDLVIGAVLIPGASAPKLVKKQTIGQMQARSVVADVAIDQGGCFETSRETNFADPIYVEHGIIHQCITNLPAAVPRTSTYALNHATMPYILEIASKGYKKACLDNPGLLSGLNLCQGMVTHESVARAMGEIYTPAIQVLQA